MIKNYTDKEYANKAVEANSLNKMLYILVTPTEFEKDVLDFTTQTVQQPVYNENGEQIGTEDVEIQVPVMIDKEVPVYDENGEQTGTETITVQSSHKEKYTENVATLVIAEPNYYICYQDNYTYGEINENLEQEKAQAEAERIAMLNLTGADVERAIYKARGMDFDDIVELVEQYNEAAPLDAEGQSAAIDIKALKIELKANNFYRGNPYINAVGTLLGFTSDQLDEFFETGDYTALLT